MHDDETERQAPALSCRGIVKRYEDVVALDGLDLEVQVGECFGLLGPNGAGKTTTIEILEGLTHPDRGEVEVLGHRWGRGYDQQIRENLGVQLQETKLADKLTVEETLRLFRSFYRRGREIDEVIALVGLEPKRRARVHKLSGGQRQRLALACALVGKPELLFLDEPTTGLDPQARRQVWDVVTAFRDHGGTVLLTTHYMEEAAELCDRVAVVDHGKVIASGTPAELVATLGSEHIVELRTRGTVDEQTVRSLPSVAEATKHGAAWRLRVTQDSAGMKTLLAEIAEHGIDVESLATHEASLEDVFVHLTGRGLRDA